jgi:hypothetical protein
MTRITWIGLFFRVFRVIRDELFDEFLPTDAQALRIRWSLARLPNDTGLVSACQPGADELAGHGA